MKVVEGLKTKITPAGLEEVYDEVKKRATGPRERGGKGGRGGEGRGKRSGGGGEAAGMK